MLGNICLYCGRWRTVAALAGVAVIAAGLLAPGCRRAPSRPPAAPPGKTAPSSGKQAEQSPLAGARAQVKVGQIVIAEPTGQRLWRASAQSIDWDYDKQQAVLRDVQCQFIENDKPALEARAPRVVAYMAERRVVMQGGVTARAPATETALQADQVQWNVSDKEVYATGNVKYVRAGVVLTGPRLRADLNLRKARLEGGVHMQAVEPLGGRKRTASPKREVKP